MDCTDNPYGYDLDQSSDEPLDICRTGALYDESLWAQYMAACQESLRLERLIRAALINEPWDEVEIALATRARACMERAMDDDLDVTGELNKIDAEALKHAESCLK